MSAEELKTYRPDLVLTFSRPNELKQLSALNIPAVYGVISQSLDDVKDQLRVYAAVRRRERKNTRRISMKN